MGGGVAAVGRVAPNVARVRIQRLRSVSTPAIRVSQVDRQRRRAPVQLLA
jgi:hypothetical protein